MKSAVNESKALDTEMSASDWEGPFGRGEFEVITNLPKLSEFTVLIAVANTLKDIPHQQLLSKVAVHFRSPLFLYVSQITRIWESTHFEFDVDGLSSRPLVFTEIARARKNTSNEYVEWDYGDVRPFNPRDALLLKGSESKLIRRAKKEVKNIRSRLIKENKMIRLSERGGAHFSIKKIKHIVVDLENYFEEVLKAERGKLGLKTGEYFGKDDLPHGIYVLDRPMSRYQIIADILNWRLNLDAVAIEGGENIPIQYSAHDIKMMFQRQ